MIQCRFTRLLSKLVFKVDVYYKEKLGNKIGNILPFIPFRQRNFVTNMNNENGPPLSNSQKNEGRGALIVLEGCDKAGKSTQCRMLVDGLNKLGRKSHLFVFPDRTTEIGKMIDEYLKCTKTLSDETVHLLFSSNRWEQMPAIRKLLEKGESVILDRYAFSGVAFSAAKGTLDLEWCKAPDVGLPQPDVVYFLNLSEKASSIRGDFGHERYEKVEFQKRVKEIFFKIHDKRYWKIIDADSTKDELHRKLLDLSQEVIDSSRKNPILPLWKGDVQFSGVFNVSQET